MNSAIRTLLAFCLLAASAFANVSIDDDALGKSLGGWNNRDKKACEYDLSGATYRTYKPEISPTPDGGIFVSIRIDHVRGWLASDDHAILEITIDSKGTIISAQSNIAIQGRSISSDVILGVDAAGKQVVGMDRAVQVGTDLIANLSAKLLQENIVEAGRVSFPAAVRHNYNRLFQAIRVEETPVAKPVPDAPVEPQNPPVASSKPAEPKPGPEETNPIQIKPYTTPGATPVCPPPHH